MARGIQEKSADTLVIENRLRKAEVGEIVTYDDLSTLLGRDVRKFCYGNIQTARKTLMGEQVFFDVVAGEGLKRLTMEEACDVSAAYVNRAKSAANRGLRHLQNVEFKELSDDGKRKHLATSAQLGAVRLFSSSKSAKVIESKVNGSAEPIPLGETLKLFTQ